MDERIGLVNELERRRELTVTRSGPHGRPLSTTVAFCNDGAMVYFIVPGDSEAFQGLEPDTRVTLMLGDSAPQPMMAGLARTRISLAAASVRRAPVNALITEVTDPIERARATHLLARRYEGLGRVIQRASENGYHLRVMRAVPFVGLAAGRPANAA